jgi:hypothetical protein
MPIQVLQRDSWDREPRKQGATFRLKKGRLTAECELWSHPLGRELKLVAGKEFLPDSRYLGAPPADRSKAIDIEHHLSKKPANLLLPGHTPGRPQLASKTRGAVTLA